LLQQEASDFSQLSPKCDIKREKIATVLLSRSSGEKRKICRAGRLQRVDCVIQRKKRSPALLAQAAPTEVLGAMGEIAGRSIFSKQRRNRKKAYMILCKTCFPVNVGGGRKETNVHTSRGKTSWTQHKEKKTKTRTRSQGRVRSQNLTSCEI